MWRLETQDKVGLGWRPLLAPHILSNLDRIDVVEVILDDYFNAPVKHLRALKTLAAQIPVIFHGVSLGLATTFDVDPKRLDHVARLINQLQPPSWSEHLAFVRAGGIEIGHLAAPPRTPETIEGCFQNLQRVQRVVGSLPLLENIATLIDPPCSSLSEPDWTSGILRQSDAGMLLDLNNLYANAFNLGLNPLEFLQSFPFEHVAAIHLSGGRWIEEPENYAIKPGSQRFLDDHCHDVPEVVFQMLELIGECVPNSLTVILERDGNYPAFGVLLDQIQQARSSLARGRLKRQASREVSLERSCA